MSRTVRHVAVTLTVLAFTASLAACSSDDSGDGGSSASPGADTPTVVTFDVGDAMCTMDTGTVQVNWTTEHATSVEFAVDGEAPGASAGYGASGEATLDIPCSGGTSTISITPSNEEGAGETVEKQVGG